MRLPGQQDTIAAIATPPGQGGIGIVRISGQAARSVLSRLWRGSPAPSDFESHKLYYGSVSGRGSIIDRVFAVWMGAPKSYTGDDVVEISGHGGHAVMQRLLTACCDAGARPAEPGEFTRRAFLAGKIDLVQAEAVADVIAASSEAQLKVAQGQREGRLSKAVNGLGERIKRLRAEIEAAIDFPEEDIEIMQNEGLDAKLGAIIEDALRLSSTFDEGRLIRDGVRVAIAGLPNAGKSSLLNALVGHERAIVHHEPGTTRDVVEATVQLGGMVFHLRDTAGLREAPSDVENIGVDRALSEMRDADIVIYLIDTSRGIRNEDTKNVDGILKGKALVVYSKADLSFPPGAPREGDNAQLHISSHTGAGLGALKHFLLTRVRSQTAMEAHGAIVTNARHRSQLDEAVAELTQAQEAIQLRASAEFTAHHLRRAHEAFARITGSAVDDELLDEIFSRFCIGK